MSSFGCGVRSSHWAHRAVPSAGASDWLIALRPAQEQVPSQRQLIGTAEHAGHAVRRLV